MATFIPLTEMDRRLHAEVSKSRVDGLSGAVQIGNPNAELTIAITYGTHLKEARVVGKTLDYLLNTAGLLHRSANLILVCTLPRGVDLAYESDDHKHWKQFRAYPGDVDGNRLSQVRSNDDFKYVRNRVQDIRELFTRRHVQYLLDIHATDGKSTPGYLGCAGHVHKHAELIPLISVDHFFTNVGKVQLEQGTYTHTFSSASGALVGTELEMGQTGTQEAYDNCLRLVREWGIAVGAFRGEPKIGREKNGYRMVASYMAPSPQFEVADPRLLKDLALVEQDEPVLINRSTGETVKAGSQQHLTWGPDAVKLAPEDLGSEIFFGCVPA